MTLNVKVIRVSDINRCPRRSLIPAHYRDDGSCKCPGGMVRLLIAQMREEAASCTCSLLRYADLLEKALEE